jgi:light-regulated signal transduction histidine kinase (bacteriophytochrome)
MADAFKSTGTMAPPSAAAGGPQGRVEGDLDLTTCDREPIHVPGSIQPHGYLIALREPGMVIERVSANVTELTGTDARGLIGQGLEAVIGRGQAEAVRAAMGAEWEGAKYLHTMTMTGGKFYHVSAHRSGGRVVVEMESAGSDAELSFQNLYPLVRDFISRLAAVNDVVELCDMTAREVRRITGFERVLVYRFAENWDGHVVAEDRDERAYGSFMDLWFPASDIPKQARELYRLNRLRQIVDAAYRPVPLVGGEDEGPLDLSYASLRSVSPIHCEYLKNMGLAASFSIAIQRDGRLWGLISCHHRTPRLVKCGRRATCWGRRSVCRSRRRNRTRRLSTGSG